MALMKKASTTISPSNNSVEMFGNEFKPIIVPSYMKPVARINDFDEFQQKIMQKK